MFEILLSSKVPMQVEVLNANFLVDSCNKKLLVMQQKSSFSLRYHFAGKNSVVYNATFNFTQQNLVCDNANVNIVKFEENKYMVEILQKNAFFLQKKVKKLQIDDVFYNFYQNGLVEVESNSKILFSEIYDFQILDADAQLLNNGFVAIKLFGAGQEACLVLNNNFIEVDFYQNTIIEKTADGYKILTNLKNIAAHGMVRQFVINQDATLKDEYSVYLKGRPVLPSNNNVIPLYFAQCIKAKDYTLAKSFLCEELADVASKQHLAGFFGNFDAVYADYFNGDKNTLCFQYQNNGHNFVKKYKFSLTNGKITNIK